MKLSKIYVVQRKEKRFESFLKNRDSKHSGSQFTFQENLGKLVENISSKTTRRKQLVENTRWKTRRKASHRKFSGGKLVARTESNLRQI